MDGRKLYLYSFLMFISASLSLYFNSIQSYIAAATTILVLVGSRELISRQKKSRTRRQKLLVKLLDPLSKVLVLGGLTIQNVVPKEFVLLSLFVVLMDDNVRESIFRVSRSSMDAAISDRYWLVVSAIVSIAAFIQVEAVFWGTLLLVSISIYNIVQYLRVFLAD